MWCLCLLDWPSSEDSSEVYCSLVQWLASSSRGFGENIWEAVLPVSHSLWFQVTFMYARVLDIRVLGSIELLPYNSFSLKARHPSGSAFCMFWSAWASSGAGFPKGCRIGTWFWTSLLPYWLLFGYTYYVMTIEVCFEAKPVAHCMHDYLMIAYM